MAERTTIDTTRLQLRAGHRDDAAQLFEAFGDAAVMTYWSEPPHVSPDRTRQWLGSMMNSGQNGITDFIICLKAENGQATTPEPIGKVGIYRKHPSNEIGFLVARKHWRKGYAMEAIAAALDYLFALVHPVPPALRADINDQNKRVPEELRHASSIRVEANTTLNTEERQSDWFYPSVTADVDPRNAASIGVLERLGFVKSAYVERSLSVGDEVQDSQYFRLTRDQWVERRPEAIPH